jgi:hypothetical protein
VSAPSKSIPSREAKTATVELSEIATTVWKATTIDEDTPKIDTEQTIYADRMAGFAEAWRTSAERTSDVLEDSESLPAHFESV